MQSVGSVLPYEKFSAFRCPRGYWCCPSRDIHRIRHSLYNGSTCHSCLVSQQNISHFLLYSLCWNSISPRSVLLGQADQSPSWRWNLSDQFECCEALAVLLSAGSGGSASRWFLFLPRILRLKINVTKSFMTERVDRPLFHFAKTDSWKMRTIFWEIH